MKKQLQKLAKTLAEKSKELNLFSAKDRDLLEEKHFPDALAVCDFWGPKAGMRVLDLGSGGGIPALPLSVMYPAVEFTLSDARQKKMDAMYDIKRTLDLKNVVVISGRFEETAQLPDFREKYDIVTARAVAPLPVLLEYTAGFLKVGGQLFAWKGPGFEDELTAARRAMHQLHMKHDGTHNYTLPSSEARYILRFTKAKKTPQDFPRADGVPKAKPL